MSLFDRLSDVTGTELVDGEARLLERNKFLRGTLKYVNSGVCLQRQVDKSALDFELLRNLDDRFELPLHQGSRFNITHLHLPGGNDESQQPHCHPGGEFAYVIEGEYFDADMQSNVLRVYPAGSSVFYALGSTHRPLSRNGADILYISFDGIMFGKDPKKLIEKMLQANLPENAVEYALLLMIEDATERSELFYGR